MSLSPYADALPPAVRAALDIAQQRALEQGLSERASTASTEPPVARSAPRRYLYPPHRIERVLWLRSVAALIGLALLAATVALSVAVWASDLSHVAALATIAMLVFALALLEVWALPALYLALSWRALAVRVGMEGLGQ